MDFKLDGLIVAIFGILPGFVSTAVRQTLAPAAVSSAGEWVARSVVASMIFNLLSAAAFAVCFLPDFFSHKIKEIETSLYDLPGWYVPVYLSMVYYLAVIWGLIAGLGADLAPRVLAYRFRLTPVTPTANVFNAVLERLVRTKENLELRGHPEQQVPWLRIQRADSVVIGRLTVGTVKFEIDKPIEAFLSPALILTAGPAVSSEPITIDGRLKQGLYLRIRPEDVVEIFVARADWQLPVPAPDPGEPAETPSSSPAAANSSRPPVDAAAGHRSDPAPPEEGPP